jgi:hypothetical protein
MLSGIYLPTFWGTILLSVFSVWESTSVLKFETSVNVYYTVSNPENTYLLSI